MSTSTRALAAALAACILGPVPAHAAGFAIFEQGARGMGFAGAFTAQANDPSAIFHNAAGIAFLKGKQFYLGGTLIHPSSTFTGADPFPGASVTEKGDTGLVVPPGDVPALRDALIALLADPDGGLWAGTGRGLAHVDGRSSKLYARAEGLTHTMDLAIHPDGSVYVATRKIGRASCRERVYHPV